MSYLVKVCFVLDVKQEKMSAVTRNSTTSQSTRHIIKIEAQAVNKCKKI